MQTTAEYFCAFCGEPNFTFVDLSAGMEQSYVEDCQVCCRPNILYLRVDEQTLDIEIDSDYLREREDSRYKIIALAVIFSGR